MVEESPFDSKKVGSWLLYCYKMSHLYLCIFIGFKICFANTLKGVEDWCLKSAQTEASIIGSIKMQYSGSIIVERSLIETFGVGRWL